MKFSKSSLIASLFIILAIGIGVMLSVNRKAGQNEEMSVADSSSTNTRQPRGDGTDPRNQNSQTQAMTDRKIATMSGDDWREFFASGDIVGNIPSAGIQAEIIALADDLRTAENSDTFSDEDVAVYVETIRVLVEEDGQNDLEAE